MIAKTFKPAFLFILTCAVPACVAVDSGRTDIALIKARVLLVEDVPDPPPSRLEKNYVRIGGSFKATMTVSKVLFGQVGQKNLVLTMQMASWPVYPFDVFVLVEKEPNRDMHVVWWDRPQNGLCMTQEIEKQYDMELAVADLQREYPCKLKYFSAGSGNPR